MFILRLAIRAFHLAEAELSDDSPSRKEKKSLTSPTYPLPIPSHSVDPIIFQFGRKRPSDSDALDTRQHLFSPKRLCLDASSEIPSSSLLYSVFLGCEEPSAESTKRSRLSSYPSILKRPPPSRKRAPLNGSFHNANQDALPMSALTYQWLVTAFWGQMLAARAWTPPKEEPLDLSCKQSKSQFVNSNIFSSIRRLAEPVENAPVGLEAEIRRCNTFPQTFCRPTMDVSPRNLSLERLCLLPTFEALVNSARLFIDLKSNYLNSVDQRLGLKNLPYNESADLQHRHRNLKILGLI